VGEALAVGVGEHDADDEGGTQDHSTA